MTGCGWSPSTSRTESCGSSEMTVWMPTRMAAWRVRSRWVRRRDSGPLKETREPSEGAMAPFEDCAQLNVTTGSPPPPLRNRATVSRITARASSSDDPGAHLFLPADRHAIADREDHRLEIGAGEKQLVEGLHRLGGRLADRCPPTFPLHKTLSVMKSPPGTQRGRQRRPPLRGMTPCRCR